MSLITAQPSSQSKLAASKPKLMAALMDGFVNDQKPLSLVQPNVVNGLPLLQNNATQTGKIVKEENQEIVTVCPKSVDQKQLQHLLANGKLLVKVPVSQVILFSLFTFDN